MDILGFNTLAPLTHQTFTLGELLIDFLVFISITMLLFLLYFVAFLHTANAGSLFH